MMCSYNLFDLCTKMMKRNIVGLPHYPRENGFQFKRVIRKHTSAIDSKNITTEAAMWCITVKRIDDKATLEHVMTWCSQLRM